MESRFYVLPKMNFEFKDFKPYISEEQLKIHYEKHHQAYIDAANKILEKLDSARKNNVDIDMKSTLKEFSFNVAGHLLHSIFWDTLSPAKKTVKEPKGALAYAIEKEFGNFERFKKEFSSAALSIEGSGWAALAYCKRTERLVIMQIEKHNVNLIPGFKILMVLDVFEHAYYLDYKNARAKYIDAFWNIINWDEINRKYEEIK